MAQSGQHYIEHYLTERDVLPGRAGMHNVSQDEQRHIGFGVKLLSDLVAEDPECKDAVAELLREVIPWTAAVIIPPGWDRRCTECFGFTLEDISENGARSLQAKLRAAGIPSRSFLAPTGAARDDTASRESGGWRWSGPASSARNGSVRPTLEHQELLFDTMRRSVNPDHGLTRPITLSWDFRDAQPWSITIDNGSASAEAGHVEYADLTFRCRYEDWVDVVAGRLDARLAMLTAASARAATPCCWRGCRT